MGLFDYVGRIGTYDLRYDLRCLDGVVVDVYKNLHTGRWSVRAANGDMRGKVIAHADEVYLADVEFIVNEVGRNRVIERQRKEVHAFVRGRLLTVDVCGNEGLEDVYYNPYVTCEFCNRVTGESLHSIKGDVRFTYGSRVLFKRSE